MWSQYYYRDTMAGGRSSGRIDQSKSGDSTSLVRQVFKKFESLRNFLTDDVNGIFVGLVDNYRSAAAAMVSRAMVDNQVIMATFVEAFKGSDMSVEEKKLFARILSMLLSVLVVMFLGDEDVRSAITRTLKGEVSESSLLSKSIRIETRLARRLIESATSIVKEFYDRKKKGDLLSADSVTVEFFADMQNFYASNKELLDESKRLQKQQMSNIRI